MKDAALDQVRDIRDRAGAYMQARMGAMSERAQSMARNANDRVAQLTGRPAEAWPEDAQRFVRDHPLGTLAIAVGVGYVVGKLLTLRG
jgi:ElaB/YqjD/DUF883 family membrane-anchored ribosome-binding protein